MASPAVRQHCAKRTLFVHLPVVVLFVECRLIAPGNHAIHRIDTGYHNRAAATTNGEIALRPAFESTPMPLPLTLHPDRLLPADPNTRAIARELYREVAGLPIVSPHGHTDPQWFASNEPFGNATELLLAPDHYLFRMLYSQGFRLDDLGIGTHKADPRAAWRILAENFHLFRGTPSRMWLDWVFAEAFGIDVRLDGETADFYFDTISDALQSDEL